jgi:hypothetical protein
MEGFPKENTGEKEKVNSLNLDAKKIDSALWGRNIDAAIKELIKIFSIVTHLKEKRVTTRTEVDEIASDLFDEFDVAIFDYDTIFTDNVINQILDPHPIDNISFEFNNSPVVIAKGSTVESVMDGWEKNNPDNSPEAVKEEERKDEERKTGVKQRQEVIDTMFASLDSLDFSDQGSVIGWLYEYNTQLINDVDMHKESLIETFNTHGYNADKNDSIEAMLGETLKDKKRLGGVIIGYMLMNPRFFLRDDFIKDAIADWKKM